MFRVSKWLYWSPLHDKIISRWATSFMVAKKWTKILSQPFEELQGWNLEFKLITPKTILGTYFKTNLSNGLKKFFSKYKLQGLDIATLLGAEGPQQGPRGSKGPSGLWSSYKKGA